VLHVQWPDLPGLSYRVEAPQYTNAEQTLEILRLAFNILGAKAKVVEGALTGAEAGDAQVLTLRSWETLWPGNVLVQLTQAVETPVRPEQQPISRGRPEPTPEQRAKEVLRCFDFPKPP
jgi:hypothetical protein